MIPWRSRMMERLLDREEARLVRMTKNLASAEDAAFMLLLGAMVDFSEKGLDRYAESAVESDGE